MLLPRFFGREKVRSTRRPAPGRHPLVEALEGRQLLSTFTATDVVQRKHIGTAVVEVQRKHIGTAQVQRKHIGAAMIQGNHIGVAMIQGNHIGYAVV